MFDVGAGGDHVNGDCDPRVVGVAKRLQQVVGFVAFGGDLLAEFVAASEFFADDFDDVVGVQVGLGEDQCLGTSVRFGKICVNSRTLNVFASMTPATLPSMYSP